LGITLSALNVKRQSKIQTYFYFFAQLRDTVQETV